MSGCKKIFLCAFCALLWVSVVKFSAQNRTIDSLKTTLKTTGQITTRVDALSELSHILAQNNPDSAFILGNEALILAQKLNYKKGEAWAQFRIGRTYDFKQNYKDALLHYKKALPLSDALLRTNNQQELSSAKKLKGRTLVNIANLYYFQADYPKALEYYFKGLRIIEEVGDKQQAGRTLGNIAVVYKEQAGYPKALEYYLKGLKIAEDVGDKQQAGRTLANIAGVYQEQADYQKALEYYLKGLKIAEEEGDKLQFGRTLANIANVYFVQADYQKASPAKADSLRRMALEYHLKALKISEELGDKQNVGITLGNIGTLYTMLGKYKEAELDLKRALSISTEMGDGLFQKEHYKYLSILYEKTNRPALALENYKKYIALRDTIFSQENSKKLMRTEMDHEYEKKKAVADAEHKVQMENQKLVATEKEKKQNIVIASVGGGLLLVIIFAGFIFRSLHITSKQKLIIEQKNAETEHQKKEIEEKQKEILDSIHYAKRIQMAQIHSEKQVGSKLERLRKQ